MRNKLIVFAIVFQFLSLIGMLGNAYAPIYWGKEIKLKVTLYDPRDFLRGNYVKLSYNFSDLGDSKYYTTKRGTKIYAVLKEEKDGIYGFHHYEFSKPKSGIFLEGRLNYSMADFGIEAFFMPADKAKKMEKDIREKGAWAVISVMDNGKARVKDIIIENK